VVLHGPLAVWNLTDVGFPAPIVVAAVGVLGYVLGRLRAARSSALGKSLDAWSLARGLEIRHDPLTGLGNRRTLEEALVNHFALLHRYELGFAVVAFDLDQFHSINEERGPAEGDRMIQRAGRLLEDMVRETDTAVRYGGEAFVVLLPNTNLDGACALAERWRSRIRRQLSLTVSGGVTAVLDGDTPETFLARAEVALYTAKSSGRNCVYRHDGEKVESILEAVAGSEPSAGP
jgi:diguanylate cyclase (GGDEF)-like protein